MASAASTFVNSKVRVTAEDQKMINRFARLHQRSEELQAKSKDLTRDLQNYNDAADELLLLDDADGSVPFKMGTIFVHYDTESMTEKLDKLKDSKQAEIARLAEEHVVIAAEMADLKKTLYGKFGNSINLETDKEE